MAQETKAAPPLPDLVDEVVENFAQERPDLDSLAIETACRLIYAGLLMQQRAAEVLKPFGMNYTDLDVLGTLRRSGAPFELSPAALMRSVMITSGAMTACLNRLEAEGLITRRLSDTDRRSRIIGLTAKGKRLIDKALAVRFGDAVSVVERLGKKDAATLNTLLRKAYAGLE